MLFVLLLTLALSLSNALSLPASSKVGASCPAPAFPNNRAQAKARAETSSGTSNQPAPGSDSRILRRMNHDNVPAADGKHVVASQGIVGRRLQILLSQADQQNVQGAGLLINKEQPTTNKVRTYWGARDEPNASPELAQTIHALAPLLYRMVIDHHASEVAPYPDGPFKQATMQPSVSESTRFLLRSNN